MDTKALVTLCQKGNGQALSLLYENYSEKMLKVCLRYIPDPTIAQDLLHDGFVIIFTSIHSLRNPEKLEYWMKKIMRNLALQYLNHANANPTIPLTDIPEEEEPAENPFCPDFISYDKMLDIVESLPEGYCKVFKLAVLEGLSHKEIGDLLGIAPRSSSSQLFRAKILIKKNLHKLIATPHTDGISSDFPQQVSTWEEYYSYLHTRYQQGTLGKDSIGLMQIAQNNSGRIVENQQHHAPIVVGLSLSKKLNERWSLETGLQYTLLRSEFTTGEAFRIQDNQKLHYIGIPLRLSYRFWHYKRFSGYATAGMQVDIPIKGTLQSFHVTDSIPHKLGSQPVSAPWQWSVNTSIGIQYHLTPQAGIYLEPTVNYYIPDGSQLRTIRKEHPFTFTLPVGLRISW